MKREAIVKVEHVTIATIPPYNTLLISLMIQAGICHSLAIATYMFFVNFLSNGPVRRKAHAARNAERC